MSDPSAPLRPPSRLSEIVFGLLTRGAGVFMQPGRHNRLLVEFADSRTGIGNFGPKLLHTDNCITSGKKIPGPFWWFEPMA